MLRHANINDLDFIYRTIIEESKHGHFDKELQSPLAAKGLHLELSLILKKRTRVNGFTAYAIIYEHNRSPVGFTIISAIKNNQGNELWMAAIKPKLRGKGLGTKMMKSILKQFYGRKQLIAARCAPESQTMFNILSKNGFKHVATGDEGHRGMRYMY